MCLTKDIKIQVKSVWIPARKKKPINNFSLSSNRKNNNDGIAEITASDFVIVVYIPERKINDIICYIFPSNVLKHIPINHGKIKFSSIPNINLYKNNWNAIS